MISNIFSKRQKALRSESHDTFVYDDLPRPLRIQLLQIIIEFYREPPLEHHAHSCFQTIVKILRKEYGVWQLVQSWQQISEWDEMKSFIEGEQNVEKVLDGVELVLCLSEHWLKENVFDNDHIDEDYKEETRQLLANVLKEVNYRFLEHGIGYQYTSGTILRIDSTYTHKEITLPALQLLSSKTFRSANEEFLTGHEHYRHRRNWESLVSCGKAFESTMEIICVKNKWTYPAKPTAKDFLNVCYDKQLIPSSHQSQFSSLRSLLESALPPLRNRKGAAHGQGSQKIVIPNEIARYALSLTAANIVLLIEWSGIK